MMCGGAGLKSYVALPVLIAIGIVRTYLIQGMTAGAVKG